MKRVLCAVSRQSTNWNKQEDKLKTKTETETETDGTKDATLWMDWINVIISQNDFFSMKFYFRLYSTGNNKE